ncbi:MAG: ExbD/TolR family protein [Acidiferrobacteraceae bacterium]
MRMSYFERRRSRIELIPMIDVMFFLLVFFLIITLRMIPDKGIGLALPRSGTAQHLPRPRILVGILADGTVQVAGKRVTSEALARMLKVVAPRHPQVTIAAAANVPFQAFVRVMDACRRAGITGIGIATKPDH